MNIRKIVIAAVTALVLSGSIAITASVATASASAHRTPVALEENAGGHVIAVRHPTWFNITSSGVWDILANSIHWTRWRDTHAKGTGTLVVNPFDVTYTYNYHVTIWLTHVVTRHGYRYFDYMHIAGAPRHSPAPQRIPIASYLRWSWRGFSQWVRR
jgi:hypothetical protein